MLGGDSAWRVRVLLYHDLKAFLVYAKLFLIIESCRKGTAAEAKIIREYVLAKPSLQTPAVLP